jgi:hypothetical protein
VHEFGVSYYQTSNVNGKKPVTLKEIGYRKNKNAKGEN